MAVERLTRLNELIQRELGLAFERYISPALPGILVTVTGVEVTQELKDATVYVSVYGKPEQKARAMEFIQKKRALLQGEIAHHIIMRFTPRLQFKLDETAENAARVMAILDELGFDNSPEAAKAEGSMNPQPLPDKGHETTNP